MVSFTNVSKYSPPFIEIRQASPSSSHPTQPSIDYRQKNTSPIPTTTEKHSKPKKQTSLPPKDWMRTLNNNPSSKKKITPKRSKNVG